MAQIAAGERAASSASSVANPAPLGLCALALTTFVLSAAYAGLYSKTGAAIIIGPALFYGGLAQFVAGIWAFRAGSTFGATAFTSLGAFWLSFAAILQLNLPQTGIGYFLLGWAIFAAFMTLGTLQTNLGLILAFVFLTLTFLALAIGVLARIPSLGVIGGWLGIITAVLAWYTGFAGVPGIPFPVGGRS